MKVTSHFHQNCNCWWFNLLNFKRLKTPKGLESAPWRVYGVASCWRHLEIRAHLKQAKNTCIFVHFQKSADINNLSTLTTIQLKNKTARVTEKALRAAFVEDNSLSQMNSNLVGTKVKLWFATKPQVRNYKTISKAFTVITRVWSAEMNECFLMKTPWEIATPIWNSKRV